MATVCHELLSDALRLPPRDKKLRDLRQGLSTQAAAPTRTNQPSNSCYSMNLILMQRTGFLLTSALIIIRHAATSLLTQRVLRGKTMLTITGARGVLIVALLACITSGANAQDKPCKTPQELLQRLDKSVKANDLLLLQTCIPEQTSDKAKAASTVSAKRILLGKDFHAFGQAVQTKYDERVIKVLGVGNYLVLLSCGAVQTRMFDSLAKQAEIKINESENTAIAKSGEDLGATELQLVRQNQHWFLKINLELLPDGTFSVVREYEAAKQLLQSCNEALKQSSNKKDLQSRFQTAVKKYRAVIDPDKQK